MHPILKPALRRGWRDRNTVQFGVAPAHAVVLGPVDTATGSFLTLLDGTRGLELLRDEGRRIGLPDGHVDRLVERLSAAGLLDDATGGGPAAEALRKHESTLQRLQPDLASLSVVTSEPGGAMTKLAARRAMRVQIQGAGRVGAVMASVLAAAGVGHIDVQDIGCVEPCDVAPGGLPAESVGDRRTEAARQAVRRAAPDRVPRRTRSVQTTAGEPGLSLVILAPRDGLAAHVPDPATAEPLIASGTPHLYAGVVEGTGVVGPLVLPGMTACAGCQSLGRADRDPTWPRLVAQWRSGHQRHVAACDAALAMAVAGLAAAHALAFLDGGSPASTGARWEASLPGLDWHPRPVWPHPACPCGAIEQGKSEQTSDDGERHETMAG
ncbi:TOMM precursor leader peptide-binding protein [Streptomyces himalayensis]|uniref:TOMM leader peptide-binding protein n=1 Tax=Streptomyces himalayensis subsp. himalayensis TaxID=2756131 RepID=A0A7W0I6K8_9ACTN|nr:TOMM precursor leader peptide-binding protein [Streptomyces himalayensis]MBA2944405.1 TOMM precursor leader peptide-binding protein [Streptomyces himalayensis subsp. himalayensis]